MSRLWTAFLCTYLLAGCAPPSSVPQTASSEVPVAQPPEEIQPARHESPAAVATVDLPFMELLPGILQTSVRKPACLPHRQAFGTWLCERGKTRTWLRIESPLIHLIVVDKSSNTSWVLDGRYATARDGTTYGVFTEVDHATDEERCRALWENDERILRGSRSVEKKLMPFSCEFRPADDDLVLTECHGTCLAQERERVVHGHYQRMILSRPTYARFIMPLGTWVTEPSGGDTRITMVIQPGRLEFRLFNHRTGQRIHVGAEYDLGPNNVLFGVVTSVQHGEIRQEMTGGAIKPQAFCLRYGMGLGFLVVEEVQALGLQERTAKFLLGEYRPPNQPAPKQRHRS